jgi:hypothetical protein
MPQLYLLTTLFKHGMVETYCTVASKDGDDQHRWEFLTQLRSNMVQYVPFLHRFAPCVISKKKWKRLSGMETLGDGRSYDAFDDILSVSDEAFIVLVLLNYSERWLAEGQRQHTQVRNVWINHCGNCLPVV